MPDPKTGELRGNRNLDRLSRVSQSKQEEEIKRSLELGLEAANSINDRTISLFSRGHLPAFRRDQHVHEGALLRGRPAGSATMRRPLSASRSTPARPIRPGTRFGPQAVRRISAVYDGYSVDGGVDLPEELDLCDAGDVFVIPGNIEKSRYCRG